MRRITTHSMGTYHAVREGTEEEPQDGLDVATTLCGKRVAGKLGHCIAPMIECRTCLRIMRKMGMRV